MNTLADRLYATVLKTASSASLSSMLLDRLAKTAAPFDQIRAPFRANPYFDATRASFNAGGAYTPTPDAPSARRMAQASPDGKGPAGWSFSPEKALVQRSGHVNGGYVHGTGHNAFSNKLSPRGNAHVRSVAMANPNKPVTQGSVGTPISRSDDAFFARMRGAPHDKMTSTYVYDTTGHNASPAGYLKGKPSTPFAGLRAAARVAGELPSR